MYFGTRDAVLEFWNIAVEAGIINDLAMQSSAYGSILHLVLNNTNLQSSPTVAEDYKFFLESLGNAFRYIR
ncbi:MAG UNVERIFIED_CONTAM: hypothetical protein LVQ98_06755 [Rickettsiaceae bacterium]|jgi:hypothetical protein